MDKTEIRRKESGFYFLQPIANNQTLWFGGKKSI
jgi:hypothetical protein